MSYHGKQAKSSKARQKEKRIPSKKFKRDLSLQDKAELAMKEAVRGVIERHKKNGRPLAVWRNGKLVMIPASRLPRKTT